MEDTFNVSAQEEQGREAGNKELVTYTEAKKADGDTVAGQLPVPFQPAISAVQGEGGESSYDVQRRDKEVSPIELVGFEVLPGISGPSQNTVPFMGKSSALDSDGLSEIPNGKSFPPSRSTSSSSEEAMEPSEVTLERYRKERRRSKRLKQENRELLERLRALDLANSSHPHAQGLVNNPTLPYPIQPEEEGLSSAVLYKPQSPTRCESVPYFTQSQTQEPQELIASLKQEVQMLKYLLGQAEQRLQSERVTRSEHLKSQHELQEHELRILNTRIEEQDTRIQHLEQSNAWLEQKLQENENLIEMLVHEDEFDKIYRLFEAKSNIVVKGDRCIVCDSVPPTNSDRCIHTKDGRFCDRPAKEHQQTCLDHKFKAKGKKDDKCAFMHGEGQLCGRPLVDHQDLGHSFKALGLCQSHLYPEGVLTVACGGENNNWIYDGVNHTSRTPSDCKRRLICSLCEPKTSKLEEGLIERLKGGLRERRSDVDDPSSSDEVLFSVLAYRSMVFSLYHYQEGCCNRYRADIKSIMQYGWRCHYDLRYTSMCEKPPALVYVELDSDTLPATLHLPAVCELDFRATRPTPPPELGETVVAIYGCIPPYHYVLLRDHLQLTYVRDYSEQIIRCINARLSEKVEAYYEENKKASDWLKGQRERLKVDHWWPKLTFGHLKCCLKIRVE